MSRLLLIFLLVGPAVWGQGLEKLPTSGKAPGAKGGKAGRIACDKATWDFGLEAQFATLKHDYVIRNDGKGTLNILRVVPQCQCAAGLPEKRNLAPGESTEISATMRTLTFQGRVTKTITVVTDDPVTPNFKLTVTGLVQPPYIVEPKEIHLGSVSKTDETKPRELRVLVTKGLPINILDVKSSDPHVSCELVAEPKPLPNGSIEHLFHVKMAPGLPVGHIRETLTIVTDNKNKRSSTVPVIASVSGEVMVTPRTFNMGRVKAGAAIKRELSIKKAGRADLEVQQVKVSKPDIFDAELVKVASGTEYKVVVSLKPSAKPGYHRGRLTIRTNVKGEAMHQAYFYAYVTR